MKKKIIIDNDTEKVVNKEIYYENIKNKKKSNYIIFSIIILLFIFLTWTFIYLYKTASINDFIKGEWSCSNNIELKFDNISFEIINNNISNINKGSYIISKAKLVNEEDTFSNEYYILSLLDSQNKVINELVISYNKNNKNTMTILEKESNNEFLCQKKNK